MLCEYVFHLEEVKGSQIKEIRARLVKSNLFPALLSYERSSFSTSDPSVNDMRDKQPSFYAKAVNPLITVILCRPLPLPSLPPAPGGKHITIHSLVLKAQRY